MSAVEKFNSLLAEPSRKTGALSDSIVMTTGGNETPAYSQPGGANVVPVNTVVITCGNDQVRYPHFVEFGTTKAPAHPFFWPAWRMLKTSINAQIQQGIRQAARDAWDGGSK